MKIGMRRRNFGISFRNYTTAKWARNVKRGLIPGYGKRGVGLFKNPRKYFYGKLYRSLTTGMPFTGLTEYKKKKRRVSPSSKSTASKARTPSAKRLKVPIPLAVAVGVTWWLVILVALTTGFTTTSTEIITESIPCPHETVEDPNLPVGETKITQSCVDGEKQLVYEVKTKKGEEISRELKSEQIIQQAQAEITTVGTKEPEPEPAPAAQTWAQQTPAQSAPVQDSTPQEDQNLPLKATCKDGTVQYQDTPAHPNYQGMCSKHGGIEIKHGRVP